MSKNRKNLQGKQAPLIAQPAVQPAPGPQIPALSNCPAGMLVVEAKAIATGVQAIATNLGNGSPPTTFLHRLWTFAKASTVVLVAIIGGLFALEQYFSSQQENARNQHDSIFNSAREQLGAEHAAVRANAVRLLPDLARFENIVQPPPGDYFLGAHLLNRLQKHTEQPLKLQCWMLFREFAQQPREQKSTNAGEVDIVSSALLQEGVEWEKRIRLERSTPGVDMSGSLLFKARLANARANGLDCSGMSFGAADLKFANLPSCIFDGCNLVRATLDGALLNNAKFNAASFAETSALKADFSFAKCNSTEFRKAVLGGVTFKQTTLDSADFSGAKLDGAIFSQASIRGARFAGASLRGTIFSQTDVSTASFDTADVEAADFTAAIGITKALLVKARNPDKAQLPPEQKTTTNTP